MRLLTVVAWVLVTCGPLLAAGQKKMIFVIPRTVRRTQTPPWRHFTRPPFPKFLSNELPPPHGHSPPHPKFPSKTKSIFFNQNPRHTDSFDQTPDKVNHVVIPQGKGITHAFGNGYIPHEPISDPGFPDSTGTPEQIEHNSLNYYSHPQVTQQTDNYLQHYEEAHQHDNQDRTDNQRGKYFLQKNLEKPFNKVVYGIPKKPYFSPESFYNKDKSILTAGGVSGGSKEPIVLRDGIDLSHYHKKLAELASTWPGGLHASPASALSTAAHGNIPDVGGASHQLSGNFQPNTFGIGFLSSNPEAEQPGYAVQEDVQEETGHDFRTQPIQTAPSPNPQDALQAGVPQIQFTISPDPFMPSLQFPAPQGFQGVAEHLRG
ncbi:uncharacterized protein LOC107044659 [Diachasma alloeum]|uniref:uncharacterized protein LOC107044659 n=1 Tax=Diachasma alloeum TaxID=454923 RepID=UPI0007384EAF|nr:uncharacterized protein LOC107044659 [Diachasma alloeum]